MAPRLWKSASPALNIETGMPAATAFLIAPPSAPVLGLVTAMPSTFLSIAAWMSCACLVASGSFVYSSFTPSFAEAASAPLRMMSQKVSPGAWWVIMATVIVVGLAPWAPPPSVSCFPPLEEQAAMASTEVAPKATTAARERVDRIIVGPAFQGPSPL